MIILDAIIGLVGIILMGLSVYNLFGVWAFIGFVGLILFVNARER